MDPTLNPYSPGAGVRPPELAGREEILRLFEIALARHENGLAENGKILYGLRGVGKTVLLGEFEALARRRNWITVKLEASAGAALLPRLVAQLHVALRQATRTHGRDAVRRLMSVVRSFSMTVDPAGNLSVGMEVEAAVGVADSGNIDIDLFELLQELSGTARELGVGALIIVDEMQEADTRTLSAINTAVHDLGQGADPLPLLLAGAGLPSLLRVLGDATSYAERLYDYWPITALSAQASTVALDVPARRLGVAWQDDALARSISFSQGYPYLVQSLGKHSWNAALDDAVITEADVAEAVTEARSEIDVGFYRVRWQRATPAQKSLLRALARGCDSEGLAETAVAAESLGKSRQELSVPRSHLIDKGLLYAPKRGFLGFTVPGMAEYVLRQSD